MNVIVKKIIVEYDGESIQCLIPPIVQQVLAYHPLLL